MSRKGSINPAKLKVVIKIIISAPILGLSCAMRVAKFTEEEIADLSFYRYLQQSLPGSLIQKCGELHSGPPPPVPPPPPN
jgi:hypothetical protein